MAGFLGVGNIFGSKPTMGGNAANIGNQAIKAYGNQRTVAPSAGGGIIKTPAKAKATASPGSLAKPQRDINAPPVNAQYGYEPGSFDDPTIDWQAIKDAFSQPEEVAPPPLYTPPSSPGRTSGSGRSVAGGGSGLSPVPAMFVPPESVTAAPAVAQAPAVVAEAPASAVNVPGESFTSMGTPGAFGQYDRQRQSRGPTTGMSVTPEMIRRAAANRLG